jgi:hypothetical protein
MSAMTFILALTLSRICLLAAKGIVSHGRSTPNISGRNVSSGILLHAIPDG